MSAVDTIGTVCCKEECKGTESSPDGNVWTCACKKCEEKK